MLFSVQCSIPRWYQDANSLVPSAESWKLMFNVLHSTLRVHIQSSIEYCSMFNVQCSMLNVQCWMFNVECSIFSVECSMLFNVQCWMLNVQCWMFNVVQCSGIEAWMQGVEYWVLTVVLCSPLSVQCSTLKHQCWRLVEGWSSCYSLLCDAFLLAVEASYHQTMKLCVTPVFLGTSVPSWDSCKWY